MKLDPLPALFKLLTNDRRVEDVAWAPQSVTYWQHGNKYCVTFEDGLLMLREAADAFIIHGTSDPDDMHSFICI